jgi:uncharacterized protein YggE
MKKETHTTKNRHATKHGYNTLPIVILIFAVLVTGLGVGSAIASPLPGNGNGNGNGNSEHNSITTTGIASMSIDPNKLEIYLGVETQADTAQASQQENAAIINDIRTALISSGIDADSINTNMYNIYPIRDYTEFHRTENIIGYRTIHILKIESDNVNIAGNIIDIAADNGANKIDNVVFTLNDEDMNQARTDLLADAALSAREKADSIAGALGVQIVRVHAAVEGYYNYMPYRYDMAYAVSESGVSNPTQITPGQIQISATVTVDFEIA